jgi:cold shock CspA family protein
MATEQQLTTSGRVKWFNNKAGYGFISVPDCETNEERDMFVHHSEIKVEQTQYKYLVQGEYVEFVIAPINRENKIDTHATNVRGINGGKLMCETRNEVRSYRATTQGSAPAQTQQASAPTQTRQASTPRQPKQSAESRRPQLDKADQSEWMVVPRRRAETAPSKQKNQPRQRQPEIEIAQ